MEQGEHCKRNQGDDHAGGHNGRQDSELGKHSTERTQASPGGQDEHVAGRARDIAPDKQRRHAPRGDGGKRRGRRPGSRAEGRRRST